MKNQYDDNTMIEVFPNSEIIKKFFATCKRSSNEQRLDYILEFALEIKRWHAQNKDVFLEKLSTQQDLDNTLRKLLIYFHADKIKVYGDITAEQRSLLNSAAAIINLTRSKIVLHKKLTENKFKKLCTIFNDMAPPYSSEINDAPDQIKDFEKMQQIESDFWSLLKINGAILSDQTLYSLVHTYGKSVSYLIRWASDYDLTWLSSNLSSIEEHLRSISHLIKKANAEDAFVKALQLSVAIDDSDLGNQLIGLIGESISNNEQKEQNNIKNITMTGVGVITSGLLQLTAGPAGWAVFSIAMTITISQFLLSRKREVSADHDRQNVFKKLYEEIEKDAHPIYITVKEEVEYYKSFKIMPNTHLLQIGYIEQLEIEKNQLLQIQDRSETDNQLLELLEDEYQRIQQEQKQIDDIFSNSEKAELDRLGFTYEGLPQEEALQLLEQLNCGYLTFPEHLLLEGKETLSISWSDCNDDNTQDENHSTILRR